MASNKFKIGETVLYRPRHRRKEGPHGAYEVTRLLPRPEDGEPVYRIRNRNEDHERDVKESELQAVRKDDR
jgi:hypothetical protein